MLKDFFRRYRISILLAGSVLLASVAVSVSLYAFSARAGEPEEDKNIRLVETRAVEYTPYTVTVRVQGFIESSRSLTLSAAVSGQVTDTYKDLKSGTEALEGTLLVHLDDEMTGNSLALARSGLISSTAQLLAVFKSEENGIYSRWNSYLKSLNTTSSAVPELPEIASEREKLLVSTYGVLEAYYRVRELEDTLERYRIYAPFSGHISGDGVKQFSYVSTGQTLLTLTDSRNLEISLPLTREEILLLGELQPAVAITPAGTEEDMILPGSVERRDAVMDRGSQTIDLHIAFENPDLNPLFLPGNYAEVEIYGKTLDRALILPRSLLNADRTINAFDSGRLKKYPVQIVGSDGDSIILAPTLPEGTSIITTRIQKPFEGMEVKVEAVEQ